jgi:hypothetical protein
MPKCGKFGCACWATGGLEEVIIPNDFGEVVPSPLEPERVFFCDDHEEEFRSHPNYCEWRLLDPSELERF